MNTEQLHSHISYTLQEGDRLSELGIKTMQTRPIRNCIVPGKLTMNGDVRLVYSTEELSPVEVLMSRFTTREVLRLLADLAGVLSDLEESAFLDKRYIDLNPEHIYISQEDETTRFVMVPAETDEPVTSDEQGKGFFNILISKCQVLNSNLEDFIKKAPGISDVDSEQYQGLTLSEVLDAVQECFKDLSLEEIAPPEPAETKMAEPVKAVASSGRIEEIELRYRGVHGAFAFFNRKEEFIIGKELTNDGVLSVNPAVSRKHCRIVNAGIDCYVEDMGSKNGTFINGKSLLPGQPEKLASGDKLQIADMSFDVVIHKN